MVAPYLADPTHADPTQAIVAAPAGATDRRLRLVDHVLAEPSQAAQPAMVATPATSELTAELDGARAWYGMATDEILLAALGRTVARTLGDGVADVDVTGERSWLLHTVALTCATAQQLTATEMLSGVHAALGAATGHATASSEILLNVVDPVAGASLPVGEQSAGLGHALELRVYRVTGDVQLDWWYDATQFDRYTVEELAEQFPRALFEMTSDATPPF